MKGTSSYGITFGSNGTNERTLIAYSDADFAANVDDRRSTTGVLLILNGGPIS